MVSERRDEEVENFFLLQIANFSMDIRILVAFTLYRKPICLGTLILVRQITYQ